MCLGDIGMLCPKYCQTLCQDLRCGSTASGRLWRSARVSVSSLEFPPLTCWGFGGNLRGQEDEKDQENKHFNWSLSVSCEGTYD